MFKNVKHFVVPKKHFLTRNCPEKPKLHSIYVDCQFHQITENIYYLGPRIIRCHKMNSTEMVPKAYQ